MDSSLKTGTVIRQPFCSQLEERLLLCHTAVYDRDSRVYRNAAGGGTLIEGNRNHRQTSLLQAGAHSVQHLKMDPDLVAMREGAKSVKSVARPRESADNLVECPDCGRMRSLSPSKGVLRFKPHTRRKQQTPLTEKRWLATGKHTVAWLEDN